MCGLFWVSLGLWFGMEEAVVYNYSDDVSFGRWCAPALPPNHISILCLSVSQFQSFQWFLFLRLCSAFRVFSFSTPAVTHVGFGQFETVVWKQCFTTLMSVRMSCAPSLHLITSPSSWWASFRAAFQFLHLFSQAWMFSQDFISIWKKPAGSYLLHKLWDMFMVIDSENSCYAMWLGEFFNHPWFAWKLEVVTRFKSTAIIVTAVVPIHLCKLNGRWGFSGTWAAFRLLTLWCNFQSLFLELHFFQPKSYSTLNNFCTNMGSCEIIVLNLCFRNCMFQNDQKSENQMNQLD